MDQSSQTNVRQDEGSGSTSGISPMLVALIAALSGVFGSAVTAYTTQNATSKSATQVCVARIDDQEQRLREKASVFLGNLGRLISSSPEVTIKENAKLMSDTAGSGYELAAYSPQELLNNTSLLITYYYATTIPQDKKDFVEAAANSKAKMTEWPALYQKAMQDFDRRRSECGKN